MRAIMNNELVTEYILVLVAGALLIFQMFIVPNFTLVLTRFNFVLAKR